MKKDKFCISKTLIYLIVLILIGLGIFYGANYINNKQKAVLKSKADFGCPGGKFINITQNNNENLACNNYLSKLYPTNTNNRFAVTPYITRTLSNNQRQVCCQIVTQPYNCSTLQGIIKGVDTNIKNNNSNCAYYTGAVRSYGPYTNTPNDCVVAYKSNVYCNNPTPSTIITFHPNVTISQSKTKFDQVGYCASLKDKVANYVTKKQVKTDANNIKYIYVGVRYFTGKVKDSRSNLAGPFYCATAYDPNIIVSVASMDSNLYSINGKDPYNMNNMYNFVDSISDKEVNYGCFNGLVNGEEGYYSPYSNIKVKCENKKLIVIEEFTP